MSSGEVSSTSTCENAPPLMVCHRLALYDPPHPYPFLLLDYELIFDILGFAYYHVVSLRSIIFDPLRTTPYRLLLSFFGRNNTHGLQGSCVSNGFGISAMKDFCIARLKVRRSV